MDKQEWIAHMVSEMMYEDEWIEYAEAMDIALRLWENMNKEEEDDK